MPRMDSKNDNKLRTCGSCHDCERDRALANRTSRVLARPAARLRRRFELPAGFEDVDLAILDWIAAEWRRSSCDYLPL